MSRRFTSWVVATLTTLLVTSLPVIMGSVTPASAAPGDPIIPSTPSCVIELVSGDPATAPPAPTCYDPSGSDLDEFLVPEFTDANGNTVAYEDGNWSPYKSDQPNSTRGAGRVDVIASYYDSSVGYYVKAHTWALTFNTSVTAQPGPNTYWLTVGSCSGTPGSRYRPVTAYFKNEVGVDGRYVGYVYPASAGSETVAATRVLDGSTVGIPLITDESRPGLVPGATYPVVYWLEDRNSLPGSGAGTRRIGATLSVFVPRCGDEPTTSVVKPRAKIVVLKRGPVFNTVKVVLGSRQATLPTRYKIIRDPRRGPTLRKTYRTTFKVVKYYKIRKGTVIKVRFQTTVLRRRI